MSRIDLTPADTTVIAAAPEDPEVGRLVEGRAGVAMHAADPAGGEHADAGLRGEQRGRGDGGAAARGTGHRDRKVADAELQRPIAARQPLELLRLEADVRHAVEHRDRRRNRTPFGHRLLEFARRAHVLGTRQAVGDDRRLQCDERLPVTQRAGDGL